MKPYYEGWYMKQQQGSHMLAVIAGRAQSGTFIQVIGPGYSHYIPYPLATYSKHKNIMRVAGSLFTPYGMRVNIHTPQLCLRGKLSYTHRTPLQYGIMGPFAPLSLETKHEVLSMRHNVQGTLYLNSKPLRFTGGTGYMEGDRGTSFPTAYTWLQACGFSNGASVMAAVATIPLGKLHFTGCIAVVSLHGKEYRFATYLGVKIVRNTRECVELQQRGLRLVVELDTGEGHSLQAPVQGQMHRPIYEHPAITAHFRFYEHGNLLLDETNPITSFEFVQPEE